MTNPKPNHPDVRMTWTLADVKRMFPNAVERATDEIVISADAERPKNRGEKNE